MSPQDEVDEEAVVPAWQVEEVEIEEEEEVKQEEEG